MEKYSDLTSKQIDVLIFIKKFIADNNFPPSIREICKNINLKSPATVHVHINNLIDKGYLKRSNSGNHSLELLTANEFVHSDLKSIPIINSNSYITSFDSFIDNTENNFVYYKNMISNDVNFIINLENDISDVGFFKGDFLFVNRYNSFNDGDIIVYIDNGHLYIKRFNKLINISNYEIIGKVTNMFRSF